MSKYAIENVEWPENLSYMQSESRIGPSPLGAVAMNKNSEFEVKVVPAQAYAELLAVAAELRDRLAIREFNGEATHKDRMALGKFNGGIPSVPPDDHNEMIEAGQTVIANRKDRG